MTEFVNRMAAQRKVLASVNSYPWSEELFGLSSAAIRRWVVANQLAPDAPEVGLVTAAAQALNFLATRSQEQVTRDYELVCLQVNDLTLRLQQHFAEQLPDLPIAGQHADPSEIAG